MTRQHEKLLVAALAGLVILGGAAFAMQPIVADAPQRETAMVLDLGLPPASPAPQIVDAAADHGIELVQSRRAECLTKITPESARVCYV